MTSDYCSDQGREGQRLPKAALPPWQPPAAVTFTRSELCPLPGASLSRCQLCHAAPGALRPHGRQCCSEIWGIFMGSGKKVHGRTRGKHVTEPYWPPSSTRLGFKNPNAE